MSRHALFEEYMDPLLRGRRQVCRELVKTALDRGEEPRALYHNLIWPAMERVDKLFREDRISVAIENMAWRINRTVADHLQSRMERRPPQGRRILITCANGGREEFTAQMCADLFEADGWEVYLLGGGVPEDEIVGLVGEIQPQMLLIVGSRAADAPLVRQLIDRIREINACPTMNIMVSGGVFNRAAGLWREVRADLFAPTVSEALELAAKAEPRAPEARTPGAPKKRRRRRKPPLLAQLEEEGN